MQPAELVDRGFEHSTWSPAVFDPALPGRSSPASDYPQGEPSSWDLRTSTGTNPLPGQEGFPTQPNPPPHSGETARLATEGSTGD